MKNRKAILEELKLGLLWHAGAVAVISKKSMLCIFSKAFKSSQTYSEALQYPENTTLQLCFYKVTEQILFLV